MTLWHLNHCTIGDELYDNSTLSCAASLGSLYSQSIKTESSSNPAMEVRAYSLFASFISVIEKDHSALSMCSTVYAAPRLGVIVPFPSVQFISLALP